jgi:hypothetical protein
MGKGSEARSDQQIPLARSAPSLCFAAGSARRPLNTGDLLGHSVQMSLRYAHLAPDQRREAVAKLNGKPVLALTVEQAADSARLSH